MPLRVGCTVLTRVVSPPTRRRRRAAAGAVEVTLIVPEKPERPRLRLPVMFRSRFPLKTMLPTASRAQISPTASPEMLDPLTRATLSSASGTTPPDQRLGSVQAPAPPPQVLVVPEQSAALADGARPTSVAPTTARLSMTAPRRRCNGVRQWLMDGLPWRDALKRLCLPVSPRLTRVAGKRPKSDDLGTCAQSLAGGSEVIVSGEMVGAMKG